MSNITVRCIDCHIGFINNRTPEYLILKRSNTKRYPSVWQCVTGKIDADEKPINTVLREVKEETNLAPIKLWSIDTVNYYYDSEKDVMNLIPVFGMLVNTQTIELSDEHQEYEWLDIERAKNKLLWEQQKKGLIYFNNILKQKNSKKCKILEIKY